MLVSLRIECWRCQWAEVGARDSKVGDLEARIVRGDCWRNEWGEGRVFLAQVVSLVEERLLVI